jgi:uncharacterized protein YbaR (Trm112 family)
MAVEEFVSCPRCKQPGNRPPGLKLDDYQHLEAVFVDDTALVGDDLPQRVTCRNCGYSWPVPGGSIKVRKPRPGTAEMPDA